MGNPGNNALYEGHAKICAILFFSTIVVSLQEGWTAWIPFFLYAVIGQAIVNRCS
jgi:hypothetical protein